MAAHIARRLGCDEDYASLIHRAAPLHDIGKLAISDAILLKRDSLTSAEMLHMRTHPESGAEILAGSHSEVLNMAEEIALTHHEWWDGTGYPSRLRGEQIPLCGRIVALADVFDALTHARPYKQPWSLDAAIQEIDHLTGRQFDPAVAAAFLALDETDLTLRADAAAEMMPGIQRPAEQDSTTGPS